MKKILSMLLLCPTLLLAQSKSDWTLYGPSFIYDKETFNNKGFNAQGIIDLLFTADGSMIISSVESPIFIYKDGKEYGTQKFVFTKEGSKFQLVKGGETKDAASMLVDKAGNLWFGTAKGLHKVESQHLQDLEKMNAQPMIEGVRFTHETPGMPFSNVKLVRQDNAGNIWVTGVKESGLIKVEHKGLSRFDGSQWNNLLVTGAEDKEVKFFVLDDQNNPIVCSQTSLLGNVISWYKDGQWKSLGGVGKNESFIAAAYGNNNLYAATISDLYCWKNGKWEKVQVRNSYSIADMAFDKTNNLWIATGTGAVCMNSGGGQYDITAANSPLPSNTVKKIVVDGKNKKWFVTDLGVLGFKEPADLSNENMTVFTKFNSSLPDGKIESIVPYKDWLLMSNSDRGLMSFDGKSFSLLSNISETYFSNIAVDKNNVAYLGTYRFIHKYDGNTYTKWDWKDDIGKQVNHVLVDNQNTVWVAFNGVSKFDGTAWQNFNKKNAGLSSNSALKLFQDSKDNIWAALYDGVAKYDGTTWTVFTKKSAGVALGNMTGIVETKDGKIWFSNGYKLIEFDGTGMKEVAGFKEAGTLRNMFIDNDGTLLVATEENGIVKFKDGVQSFCNQFNCGLPSNAISQIHRDKNGKLWVAFGLPPKTEFAGVGAMGQSGQTTPAPQENPRDVFTKKIKQFDSVYGLMELKKL